MLLIDKDNLKKNFILILVILTLISFIFENAIINFNIIIIVVFGFLYKDIFSRIFETSNRLFILILSIFYFYTLIRSLFSIDIALSLESSLFLFRFIFFIIILSYFFEYIDFKLLKLFLYTLIIFLFIDSIIQHYFQLNIFGNYISDFRISSVFGSEKVLGSYISRLIYPIFLSIIIFENRTKKLFILEFILISSLSYAIIIFSGERFALINFIIIFLIFSLLFFLKNKKNILIIFSYLLFFALISTIFLSNTYIYDRFFTDGIFLKNEEIIFYTLPHTNIYLTAIEIIKDNLVFGIGPKMFRIYCENYLVCSTHVHNNFLQIFLDLGFFGLFFYLIFLFYLFYLIIKNLIIFFEFKINNLICLIILLSQTLINFNPLLPTGNIFGTFSLTMYSVIVSFYIFFNNRRN